MPVRMSALIRITAAAAAVVAFVAAWTLYRSVLQTEDSNARVSHTQDVLVQVELALETLTNADMAGRSLPADPTLATPPALTTAEQNISAQIDRLAALTADNSSQQSRIEALRADGSRLLATLHRLVDTRRAGGPAADEVNAERADLEAVRRDAQDIRLEENRLLRERVDVDHAAVRRLQLTAGVLLLLPLSLLATLLVLLDRAQRREARGASELRQANTDLEAAVSARTSDLQDSSTRLQSIIDSAIDGIIVIGPDGRVEAFNRGAERLFGYRADEVLGRNVAMLMPSPYHEEHDGYLNRYLESGQAKIIGIGREVTGRRRDGTMFPLHLSVGEMKIGGQRKFTGMLHDLSDRVQLEERLRASEARWRSIVQSAVDGIVVIDAHGRIEAFNPAAERLFGYQEADVMGRNVRILMPSPYHEEHDIYLARYLATGTKKIIGLGREVVGLRRDGKTFPLHLSVGEMTVNGERKFTGILHDLSARVRIEEQLREQASLVHLGEMAAVLAHEIKNPLAGIRGAIEVIGSRLPAGTRDGAVVKEMIGRIDGLSNLMKDLLLFARPPQPRLAPVELATLVSSTADLLGADPAFKGIEIRVDGHVPIIDADPELLKIVFINLLVNGAHALDGEGTIHVSLDVVGSTCRIVIRDDGPGIPTEVREKIFMPFFTTKSKGSGLGLPTVRRLVESHHGTISIACPVAGGTHVTIELPAGGSAVHV